MFQGMGVGFPLIFQHEKSLTFTRYKFIDEVTWVKTNQINATVATGRTGHWLNHLKEACIIGIKGNPKFSQKIDLNMLSEMVREASHKPDGVSFLPLSCIKSTY
jgi:mRNA (2'-O-methyladenosine-N6-)-methyltransferase